MTDSANVRLEELRKQKLDVERRQVFSGPESFESVLRRLVELGEDADELAFWRDSADALPPEKRQELEDILFDELKRLETAARA